MPGGDDMPSGDFLEECHMNLIDAIEGLVNSESDDGCDKGLTVVEKKYVTYLKKHIEQQKKATKELDTIRQLREQREKIAQDLFEESPLDGLQCIDSDNWDTDDDHYNKKFYFEEFEEGKDGRAATFVVVFEKGSIKVLDTYINIW